MTEPPPSGHDGARAGEIPEAERSRLDASWGGITIGVKVSIVVLAILTIADGALALWLHGQTNIHLMAQDRGVLDIEKEVQEMKGSFVSQHTSLIGEIERNRFFLREIEKVCILTSEQRTQLQKTLSPSLRELLLGLPQEKK